MGERHRAILEEGRALVRSGETRVAMVDPFLLAAHSTRCVTTFAFVLSAIVFRRYHVRVDRLHGID